MVCHEDKFRAVPDTSQGFDNPARVHYFYMPNRYPDHSFYQSRKELKMNALPDTYKLSQNLGWEVFEVNEYFDDSYVQLHLNDIEYLSDIFITYLPGGSNLTVDTEQHRKIVLQINRNGHHAYPDIEPGDGCLFTIYNDDRGTAQLGTKPVRLVMACENYLVFRGYDVLAVGPFGLIDPSNTDYGAVLLNNWSIRKITFYRYDTKKCYEYANTRNACKQLPLNLLGDVMLFSKNNAPETEEYTNISYERVKRNADAFLLR